MIEHRDALKCAVAIASAFALASSPLAAQQPQPPHPMQHRMPGACPMHPGSMQNNDNNNNNNGNNGMTGAVMMQPMMPGPAMMVSQRTELGLNNTQVQHLDSLAIMQTRSMQRFMPQVMRGMADLMEAGSGDIDVNAARAAHNRIAAAHSDMLVANLQAMKDARQVLTPGQRKNWDAMIAQCGGVMGMMMGTMGAMMMHHGQHGKGMPHQR